MTDQVQQGQATEEKVPQFPTLLGSVRVAGIHWGHYETNVTLLPCAQAGGCRNAKGHAMSLTPLWSHTHSCSWLHALWKDTSEL